MSIHPQSIQNNALAALENRAGAKITRSIQQASLSTGVDFAYLMQQANAESSFQPSVKAKTSSATGLFQFIDSTWLSMVDKYGAQYGIDTQQPRSELLKLRNDPELSSLMAGELARENKQSLQSFLGQDTEIGSTELYFAHFMGAGRAASFLQSHQDQPYLKGVDLFPKEAAANRGVFFDGNGRAKTLAEIYDRFDQKFFDGGTPTINTPAAPVQIAAEIETVVPRYSHTNPLSYVQKTNPYLDLLAPSTPVIRSENSAVSSLSNFMRQQHGFGNLLQNPHDLLWALEFMES